MKSERSLLTRARYYSSVVLLYAATLLFAVYLYKPGLFKASAQPISLDLQNVPTQPVTTHRQIIMGKPVRIVVPKLNVDLPVVDGRYNPSDNSWTLKPGYRAYFALPSKLINDTEGNTLIYGHSNKRVFSLLRTLKPGAQVEVYTDNDYKFTYTYQNSRVVKPDDVSVFNYQGPPILTLQTCTGNWYESRSLYVFSLNKGYK